METKEIDYKMAVLKAKKDDVIDFLDNSAIAQYKRDYMMLNTALQNRKAAFLLLKNLSTTIDFLESEMQADKEDKLKK